MKLETSSVSDNSSGPRIGWHFDFHVPRNVRVFEQPQADELTSALVAAGVEETTFFTKCHFGYSYYPTQVGVPHPRLNPQRDVLGEMVAACRRAGLRVLLYLSFGIDMQAAQAHPEWKRVYADGRTDPDDWFVYVCAFTRYVEESVLPQLEEQIVRYAPDGFWFDTMSAFRPCYCESCRAAFLEQSGSTPPVEEDDPLQVRYGLWRRARGVAVLERIAAFIRERLPEATICFNQIGSLPYPQPLPNGLNWLALDPPTTGAQSVPFSLYASFGTSTGTPCDVLPTIFNQGWGDWSLASPQRNAQIAAATWARGARLFPGDRLHPEGRLTPHSRVALQQFATLRAEFSCHAPRPTAHTAPDVLIVHSTSVTYGDDGRHFGLLPKSRLGRIEGAHRLFLDSGSSAWVVAEHNLEAWIEHAQCVVLPELTQLDDATETVLQRFVEGGGHLLTVGAIPRFGSQWPQWMGVESCGDVWQDHTYLPVWPGDDCNLPVLVRGEIPRTQLTQAQCALSLLAPYDGEANIKYGWGIGPPDDKPSEYSALAHRALGKGHVWFCSPPIFSDYANGGNHQQLQWWKQLLIYTGFKRRAWLEDAPGNIEVVTWEDDASLWAVLVNHHGEQLVGSNGQSWARVLGDLPPVAVTLRISSRHVARSFFDGQATSAAAAPNGLSLPLTLTRAWHVVRVDWKTS